MTAQPHGVLRLSRSRCWNRKPPLRGAASLVLALIACLVPTLFAQELRPDRPTAEQVKLLLEQTAQSPALDEAGREKIAEIYRQALLDLENANLHAAEIAKYDALILEAPGLLASIRAELGTAATEPEVTVAPDAGLAVIEQGLKQAEADLAAARKKLDELQAESATRGDRRGAIPEQIAGLRQRLAAVEDGLVPPPAPEHDPLYSAARRVQLQCQQFALTKEIERYEREMASYDARRDLLPARRDRAQRRVSQAEKLVAVWQKKVTSKREEEARIANEEARRLRLEAARKAPELKELAGENERLTQQRNRLTRLREETERETKERADELKKKRDSFHRIRTRVKAAGFTNAMGVILRREHKELLDSRSYRRTRKPREKQISDTQFELIVLQDQRFENPVSDIEGSVPGIIDGIAPTPEMRPELEEFARATLISRRDLLDGLIRETENYVDLLLENERVTSTLIAAIDEYASYIREHIFSVKSVEGSLLPSPKAAFEASAWLLRPPSWLSSVRQAGTEIAGAPVRHSLLGLVLLLLIVFRGRATTALKLWGEEVRRIRTDSFGKTLLSVLQTVLLSAPTPFLCWWLATVLGDSAGQEDVIAAVSGGLKSLILPLFVLVFVRQASRNGGLADAHFGWTEDSRRAIRRQIRWFLPTFLSLFLVTLVLQPPWVQESWNDSLGRVVFCAAMVVLFLFLRNVSSSERPVLAHFLAQNPHSLLARLKSIWFVLLTLPPLALLVLAATGYDYTALELLRRLLWSLELVLLLVFLNGILLRWLFVARRQLALERLRLRREAARAEEATGAMAEAAKGGSGEGARVSSSVPESVDIPAISAQTLQLSRTALLVILLAGMVTIWADLVPALGLLRRVEVWPQVRVIPATEQGLYPVLEMNGDPLPAQDPAAKPPSPADTGRTEAKPGGVAIPGGTGSKPPAGTSDIALDEPRPTISLADVGLAILLALATLICAKNIPGLMEILLLRRLPMEPGARYAASTIARYAIMIIGLTLSLGAIGIGWSTVQWLAAALTFGLAFGLQEIFANFVSGLIMLFERPVQLGDIVTVGGVDGKVSRIRMRATTITDWDNRELIVPNKEFITGHLVNWTLSDTITRVVIRVGVAYSSNPVQVRELLLKVAEDCPLVMKDPGPSAIFREFGDSALLFDLRVYLANRDIWPRLIDQLHEDIHTEFTAAGIVIAFPQLDVHLDSPQQPGAAPGHPPGSAPGTGNP
ncbi:MAG: mechanosensitive ion channel domain-containing protein [Planctomycetota bacterium]